MELQTANKALEDYFELDAMALLELQDVILGVFCSCNLLNLCNLRLLLQEGPAEVEEVVPTWSGPW